ncbi:MAG: ATP-dependent DNA helicase RecQ [Leptospiraceae bacterium]|nr:ATP-dependent DNA helicase RecQ [Leptospiraceae bacterium]MCP5511466.1 ATP-dependent DNA helicase RecQ [Leptospiraceae bacterium]
MSQLEEIIQKNFPNIRNGLKDYQEKVYKELLKNDANFLYILPTGAGKSLIYQLYPFIKNQWGIVISPLISLMKDQTLNSNFPTHAIHSEIESRQEKIDIIKQASKGDFKLLYIAPERFTSISLQSILENSKVPPSFLIVDEAHCLSEWGRDFRLDYLRIKEVSDRLNLRIIACTATLSQRSKSEIMKDLGIPDSNFISPIKPDRDNLKIVLENVSDKKEQKEILKNKILELKPKGKGLVFVISPDTAKSLADEFKNLCTTDWFAGVNAREDNGKKRSKKERDRVQKEWLDNKIDVLFCTSAFGMGLDKPNIRWIIHLELPSSLEAYWQQIGRAGRDGLLSECFVLSTNQEFRFHKQNLTKKFGNIEKIEELMDFLTEEDDVKISMGIQKNTSGDLEKRQFLSWILNKYGVFEPLFEYIPSIQFEVFESKGITVEGIHFPIGNHDYKMKNFPKPNRVSHFVRNLYQLYYEGKIHINREEEEFIDLKFLVNKEIYQKEKINIKNEIIDLYNYKKTKIEQIQNWNQSNNTTPNQFIYNELI